MTEEKRIKKYSTRSLKKFSKVRPFMIYPFRRATKKSAWKFINTILRDFFFIQLKEKLHIVKIPIVYVDTPLDDKIPFTPKKVNDYMTFLDLVLRPLDFFACRFTQKEFSTIANSYIDLIEDLYSSAGSVYRFSMSTTKRPKYLRGRFFTIHFFDPHFLCVPSLHVAVSAGVYTWFKKQVESGVMPEDEAKLRLEELRSWAVKIVESVLLVKQHSINCIPAAFYMLSVTQGKDFFSADDAVAFIDMLFCDEILISDDDKRTLIEHFHFMYERFFLENQYCERWQEPLERWLVSMREENQK